MPKLKQGIKPGRKPNSLNKQQKQQNTLDKREPLMYNENISNTGTAPDVEEKPSTSPVTATDVEEKPSTSPVTATAEVNATEQKPKTVTAALKPLRDLEKEQRITELLNDVADLKPSRSYQSLAVYWNGQDVRLVHVQDSCPFRFSWVKKNRKVDYGDVSNAEHGRIVSKKKFTLDGRRMVTTGADHTPDQDFFTVGDLILVYIPYQNWKEDRVKKAIKSNHRAKNMIQGNKEKLDQSATRLANGDIDGAIAAVSTKELIERAESGDLDQAYKESLNDGFPSTIIKI